MKRKRSEIYPAPGIIICYVCGKRKTSNLFLKGRALCKNCDSERQKEKRANRTLEQKMKDSIGRKSYTGSHKKEKAIYDKQYRVVNAEKIKKGKKVKTIKEAKEHKQKAHEYYLNNKEEIKEYNQLYYIENTNKIKENTEVYRKLNKKAIAKSKKKYYKTDIGKACSQNQGHKRRAIKKASDLKAKDILILKKMAMMFDKKCPICGRIMSRQKGNNQIWLEHATPLSKGGSHTKDNIFFDCRKCNLKKGTKTLEECIGVTLEKLITLHMKRKWYK